MKNLYLLLKLNLSPSKYFHIRHIALTPTIFYNTRNGQRSLFPGWPSLVFSIWLLSPPAIQVKTMSPDLYFEFVERPEVTRWQIQWSRNDLNRVFDNMFSKNQCSVAAGVLRPCKYRVLFPCNFGQFRRIASYKRRITLELCSLLTVSHGRRTS